MPNRNDRAGESRTLIYSSDHLFDHFMMAKSAREAHKVRKSRIKPFLTGVTYA